MKTGTGVLLFHEKYDKEFLFPSRDIRVRQIMFVLKDYTQQT